MTNVTLERDGGVAVVTLNRPELHNAIDVETAQELASTIRAFEADLEALVLVVTGAGDRSFCAGGDLNTLAHATQHPEADRAGPLGFARLDPGKPTLAAVNGYCFGGGMELACWCDFRIAAENAEFGALNRHWGLTLIDGGTQRLPRLVGYGNALWLIETGLRIDSHKALQIGLVQEIVPAGRALVRALELAEKIAMYPQSALRADRAAVLASLGTPIDEGLTAEALSGRPVMREAEVLDRLEAFQQRSGAAKRLDLKQSTTRSGI